MSMLRRSPWRSRSQKVKCGVFGTIPNRAESIRKLIKKLGPVAKLRACYEAGPTGYAVYWRLADLGVECEVGLSCTKSSTCGDGWHGWRKPSWRR